MRHLECRFAYWLIGAWIEGASPRMHVRRLVDRRPDRRYVALNAGLQIG